MEITSQDPYSVLNNINTRLRILEGRYNLTRERMLVVNQNMIDHYKALQGEIKALNEDIKDIKESIESLKVNMRSIIKETQIFARKEDVKVLEKYINMWNPVNFVTQEEVVDLIKKHRSKNVTRNKKTRRRKSTHK
jgi:signal transduction protein with GAF and PtsI domain